MCAKSPPVKRLGQRADHRQFAHFVQNPADSTALGAQVFSPIEVTLNADPGGAELFWRFG
jgi:hypothetical protein